MASFSRQAQFGIVLIFLSALTYFIHYLVFRDAHHISIFLVGDIAFVFLEVLLVTLIIHEVLDHHEKESRLKRLNTMIGAFFSEVGTDLLTYFSNIDPNVDTIRMDLLVGPDWSDRAFTRALNGLESYAYGVEPDKLDIEKLRCYLMDKRDFLLRVMGNSNLMEHESFTELLRSVFHVVEELRYRTGIADLPDEDLGHLAHDIDRAYKILVREWVSYMKHLKGNFPYFFSLAMRTNPFDRNASVVVGSTPAAPATCSINAH